MKIKKKQVVLYFLGILIFGLFFYFFNYFNIRNNYNPIVFNSPDETSNYFFAVNFAKNNSLSYQTNIDEKINFLIHPRSIAVNDNKLIPISFIGLPLIYGGIAKIFGISIIRYLTPIFAIIGIIFFFLLISKIFDKRTGLISSLLLFINPAYWYYSNKLLMHNILFISLLIITFYLFIISVQKQKILYWILWGFTLGLTLLTRLSEFLWILFVFLIILILNRKKINYKKFIIGIIILFITITPMFYFNKINNGAYLKFSYTQNIDPNISSTIGEKNSIVRNAKNIIFPFGINIKNIIYIKYNFLLKLNWPFSLILFFSLVILFIKRKQLTHHEKIYILCWILISFYILIYYGSMKITDDAIPNSVTIGSSYIRYLLPFFVFAVPIIALAIQKLVQKNRKTTVLIVAFVILFLSSWSYDLVNSKGLNSLENTSNNIEKFKNLREKIIENTENNAIIFTNRFDKFIFPHRNVVYLYNTSILNYKHIKNFNNINIPIYYFDELKNKLESNDYVELKEIFIEDSYYLYQLILDEKL